MPRELQKDGQGFLGKRDRSSNFLVQRGRQVKEGFVVVVIVVLFCLETGLYVTQASLERTT